MLDSALSNAINESDIAYIDACTSKHLKKYIHSAHKNVLIQAARNSSLRVLKLICEKIGAKGIEKLNRNHDNRGRTALFVAVVSQNVEKVNYVLSLPGTDICEHISKKSSEAIDYCVANYDEQVFELLITSGARFRNFTWEAIFTQDGSAIDFFTKERFLHEVKNRRISIVDVFCQFFIQSRKRSHDVSRFFNYKDTRNRHALLICARYSFCELLEMLLPFDFDLKLRDHRSHTLFYYLLQKRDYELINVAMVKLGGFNAKITQEVKSALPSLNYSSQQDRQDIGNMLTLRPRVTWDGRSRLAKPNVQYREYRSFEHERTRQLLRQISTQIFLFLENKKKRIKEVESMFLYYKGHSYLLITGNSIEDYTKFISLIKFTGIKNILTNQHAISGSSAHSREGRIRSRRYKDKLKTRIYQNDFPASWLNNDDKKRAGLLRRILRIENTKVLYRNNDAFINLNQFCTTSFTNKIIFIGYQPGRTHPKPRCKGLHAEETFVDLLEQLQEFAPDPNMYSIIGGKKRPCAGCFGRMLQTGVNEHGKHPGHFWSHSMKYQLAGTAKTTASVLIDRAAYESYNKTKTAMLDDYDTGSESEC